MRFSKQHVGRRERTAKAGPELFAPQRHDMIERVALLPVGKDHDLPVALGGARRTARVRHVLAEEAATGDGHAEVAVVRHRRVQVVVRRKVLELVARQEAALDRDVKQRALPGHRAGRPDQRGTVRQYRAGRARLAERVLLVLALDRPAPAHLDREAERKVLVQHVADALAEVQAGRAGPGRGVRQRLRVVDFNVPMRAHKDLRRERERENEN